MTVCDSHIHDLLTLALFTQPVDKQWTQLSIFSSTVQPMLVIVRVLGDARAPMFSRD